MGSSRVTPEEVEEFYRLYKIYGTYSKVAKATNRSASTVAKYVKAAGLKSLQRAGFNKF